MNQMTPRILDNKFLSLLQDLPPETEALAVELNAFVRQRVFRSALELLRAVLLYSVCDLRLRQIAALWAGSGRALTDEAVRARLKGCAGWVEQLVKRSLVQSLRLPACPGWRIVICDGTTLTAPGATTGDYRLHLSFDPLTQQVSELLVSDCHAAESLTRFQLGAGSLVLADRLFAKAPALLAVVKQGAQVVVRCSPHYLRLLADDGQSFDLVAALRAAAPQSQLSFALRVADAKSGQSFAAFVHARRLSAEQINRARRRVKAKASKAGRTLKAATLMLCEWVLVLTTLPPEQLSAAVVLELYRVRWQIELLIKRYKSLLAAAALRAPRQSPLAEVWLWGKLLYAVIVERLAVKRCGSPWAQMQRARRATWWRVWQLLSKEIQEMILNTTAWSELDWQALKQSLRERRRKRQLQRLPEQVLKWLPTAPLIQPIQLV
jgi:hypothetical protein